MGRWLTWLEYYRLAGKTDGNLSLEIIIYMTSDELSLQKLLTFTFFEYLHQKTLVFHHFFKSCVNIVSPIHKYENLTFFKAGKKF